MEWTLSICKWHRAPLAARLLPDEELPESPQKQQSRRRVGFADEHIHALCQLSTSSDLLQKYGSRFTSALFRRLFSGVLNEIVKGLCYRRVGW